MKSTWKLEVYVANFTPNFRCSDPEKSKGFSQGFSIPRSIAVLEAACQNAKISPQTRSIHWKTVLKSAFSGTLQLPECFVHFDKLFFPATQIWDLCGSQPGPTFEWSWSPDDCSTKKLASKYRIQTTKLMVFIGRLSEPCSQRNSLFCRIIHAF